MDIIPINPIKQFELLFDPQLQFTLIRKEGLAGRIRQYSIRGMAWMALLGVIQPPNSGQTLSEAMAIWTKEIQKTRDEYTQLKESTSVNPNQESAEDLLMNNPLSNHQDSTWAKYFEDNELKLEIQRDVVRTFQEMEFFKDPETQKALLEALFIYAKGHSIRYKQGIHELLAPLYYTLVHERRDINIPTLNTSEDDVLRAKVEFLQFVHDPQYVVHDAYALLSQILIRTSDWFLSGVRKNPETSTTNPNDSFFGKMELAELTPISQRCKLIYDMLLQHEPQLYHHFKQIQLEPQFYLLRWVRILFGREFPMSDSLVIWDAVFSFDGAFSLVDNIAIAMLQMVKIELLSRDFAGCMQYVLKYPPVKSVMTVVDAAINLNKPKIAPLVHISNNNSDMSMAKPLPVVTILEKPKVSTTPIVKTIPNPSSSKKTVIHTPTTSQKHQPPKELETKNDDRSRFLSEALQKTIESLTALLDDSENPLPPAAMEKVVLNIAELKRIKAIATGLLPMDTQM